MAEEDDFYSFENLGKDPYYKSDVRSEPLLDICSVAVFSDSFNKQQSCEVYGDISVRDLGGSEVYVIYDRPETDPELLTATSNILTLTDPDDSTMSIMSMRKPVLCVNLYNKSESSLIVYASIPLDKTASLDNLELVKTEILGGEHGFVSINYIAMSFGVFAQIDVELLRKEAGASGSRVSEERNDVESGLDVFGFINAHFEKTYTCNFADSQRHSLWNRLYHRSSSESERVTYGSQITLSRYFLAVPSYSTLVLGVHLTDRNTGKQIALGCPKFSTRNNDGRRKSVGGDLEDVYVSVRVSWYEPFDEDTKANDLHAYKIPLNDLAPRMIGGELIQVFSVFIGRKDKEPTSIYGRISILGPLLPLYDLFARDKETAEKLKDRKNSLPLTRPAHVAEFTKALSIRVALKDLDDHLVIKGDAMSPYGMTEGRREWFDSRFCSVIKGINSFVAVNYMVFANAIVAEVDVEVFSAGSGPLCVHGHIGASYSTHEYNTEYDKEYYRTWLFRKSEPNAVQVQTGSFLLSGDAIPVPVDSSLIFDVGIHINNESTASHGTLSTKSEFPISHLKRCERVEKGSHAILVSVRFLSWY